MSQYTKRTFAEVHLDRLAHNLERLKELAPGKKICAMVKADEMCIRDSFSRRELYTCVRIRFISFSGSC